MKPFGKDTQETPDALEKTPSRENALLGIPLPLLFLSGCWENSSFSLFSLYLFFFFFFDVFLFPFFSFFIFLFSSLFFKFFSFSSVRVDVCHQLWTTQKYFFIFVSSCFVQRHPDREQYIHS